MGACGLPEGVVVVLPEKYIFRLNCEPCVLVTVPVNNAVPSEYSWKLPPDKE